MVAQFIAEADKYIGPVRNMAIAAKAAEKANDGLTQSVLDLVAAMKLLDDKHVNISASVKGIAGPVAGAIAQVEALKTAMAGLGDKTVKVGVDMAGAGARTAAATGMMVGGLRLTGNAIHWLVMGTLEVAATAIPALVAFGAAAAGMYPTFAGIYDRMNALVTASGGMRNALLGSVGPLHNLGVGMGTLSKSMAPDAYVIFGSLINDIAGKFGIFSQAARQAGVVLAGFATKITQDLQGKLGNQLSNFFLNSVKYMVQWGQVLGNLGHTFINVMGAMPGAAQLLLDVLVAISRAFLALSSTHIGAILLEIAAGFSAVYRYGLLMVTIFKWLGGSFIVTAIKAIIGVVAAMGAAFVMAGGGLAGLRAAFLMFEASLGPVGIAIAAIGILLGAWYLASRQAADATSQLITRVQSATPTFGNLTHGIALLSGAMLKLPNISGIAGAAAGHVGLTFTQVTADSLALIAALRKQVTELVNLSYAFAQVHAGAGSVAAGIQAIAIQGALADSKVATLNQALDQYIALVTGGTSSLAGFQTALFGIGKHIDAFAASLSQNTAKGAQAWTTFDQIITGSMQPMMDWFRQASTLGAATGRTVSKAALDMAAAVYKYAGSNKTAQAEILGFARAQGISVKDWPALVQAIKTGHASLADLRNITDAASRAMSNLSAMAKSAAAALNSQMSTALAATALKTTHFQRDITYAMEAASSHTLIYGHDAQYWYKKAADAGLESGRLIAQGARTVSGAAASMSASAGRTGVAWQAATQWAARYQAYLNSMHGVNIVNTTTWKNVIQGAAGVGAGISGPHSPVTSSSQQHSATSVVNIHVHGSVVTEQQLMRNVQAGMNQKTIRNGSTQLFIRGRLH